MKIKALTVAFFTRRILDILGRITSIDIILENKTSFDRNFHAVTNVLNASVGQCFDDDNDKIYLPDFLTHVAECSCNYCTNSYLQDFHIRLYLQYIDSRKSFHQSKPLHLNHYREAIDSLTVNADLRFQANLSFVKRLLDYKDEEVSVVGPKKKGGKKSKKKAVDPVESSTAAKETNRKFSKYVAEARLLGENTVKGSPFSIKMVSNVELLISKLELDGDSSLLDRSSHDFQRLIAHLYYLRSLLYLESNNNNSAAEQLSLTTVNEDEAPPMKSVPVTRKTRGRTVGTVKTTTAKRKTTRKKADNKDGEDAIDVQHLNFSDDMQQKSTFMDELPKRKTTRKRTKKQGNNESDALVPAEKNAQQLSDHVHKLSLDEPSLSATPDDSTPKINKSFLEDLKKVLGLLNPYTDTLIIKAIYELVSYMTSSGVLDGGGTRLPLTTQFLASSRTLHQQVLNSIGKKLRYARKLIYY